MEQRRLQLGVSPRPVCLLSAPPVGRVLDRQGRPRIVASAYAPAFVESPCSRRGDTSNGRSHAAGVEEHPGDDHFYE